VELDTLVAPAHLWVPEHASTSGPEVADLAASVGMELDGEQRLALDAILAERPDGRWAAFEAALIAPRQNLKSFCFEALVLGDLFLFGSELVIWTAHQFPTAMEAFRHLKSIIDNHDHLRRRVKRISEANGEEAIELLSGQRLLFKARTKVSGRGLTGDRVILDEAFRLGPSEVGSLMPTLSARPNPQIVYGSSAGHSDSEVLRAVRNRGRACDDPSLAWIEWCAPVVPCADERCDHRPGGDGCALDDREAWGRANPTLGRRIPLAHLVAERRSLPPDEFARERLGWWEEPASAVAGLPLNLWEAATSTIPPGTTLAYAADVTPDFSHAALVRASAVGNGVLVELVSHRRGTSWVAAELAAHRGDADTPVALDLGSPASVLADDFAAAGIDTLNPSARDVAQACSGLLDGLVRRSVWHAPNPVLDGAVKGASRRPMGDAWAWSRKNSLVDISPLVAATLALWGAGRPAEEKPSAYEERGLVTL
jgi:hypothetical protein